MSWQKDSINLNEAFDRYCIDKSNQINSFTGLNDALVNMLNTTASAIRQTPGSIGIALKTICARMSDTEIGLDKETNPNELIDIKFSMDEFGKRAAELGKSLQQLQDAFKLGSMREVPSFAPFISVCSKR